MTRMLLPSRSDKSKTIGSVFIPHALDGYLIKRCSRCGRESLPKKRKSLAPFLVGPWPSLKLSKRTRPIFLTSCADLLFTTIAKYARHLRYRARSKPVPKSSTGFFSKAALTWRPWLEWNRSYGQVHNPLDYRERALL